MCVKKSSKQKYNKNVVLFACTSLVLLPYSCDTRTLTSRYTRRLSLIRDIRYVTIVSSIRDIRYVTIVLLLLKCKWHTFLPNKSTYTRDIVRTHFFTKLLHFFNKSVHTHVYRLYKLYKCCTIWVHVFILLSAI